MPDPSADEQFLLRAIDLARQSAGLASPNPYVGAVVVDAAGNVVGTGTHTYDGVKHAEALALEQAGEKARGGTLYINLEPCSHQGRTPPCADTVIAAGVRRVVVSMGDPNPTVDGRGFNKLRAAGIQVDVGLLHGQARRLNESFARYIRRGVPLVTLKSAMTLDGKIASSLGAARVAGEPAGDWITGEAARTHVQELRHQHDALMVGVGTILTDDPLLTDRSGRPRRRPLLRVILDSRLRLPLESRLVRSVDGKNDVLVFCSSADANKKAQLQDMGIRVEVFTASETQSRPDLVAVLRRLAELQITSVMIEGGSTVNGSALAAGIVDKIFFYYAPRILGGNGSVPFAAGAEFLRMGATLKVQSPLLHHFGQDIAVEGYLRDPYQD